MPGESAFACDRVNRQQVSTNKEMDERQMHGVGVAKATIRASGPGASPAGHTNIAHALFMAALARTRNAPCLNVQERTH